MEEADILNLIDEKVEPKLDRSTFIWVIGVMITVLIACFSFLYGGQIRIDREQQESQIKIITQLTRLDTTSQATSQDISEMKKEIKTLNNFFAKFEISVDK